MRFSPDMDEALGKIRVEPVELEPGVVKVTAQLKDRSILMKNVGALAARQPTP